MATPTEIRVMTNSWEQETFPKKIELKKNKKLEERHLAVLLQTKAIATRFDPCFEMKKQIFLFNDLSSCGSRNMSLCACMSKPDQSVWLLCLLKQRASHINACLYVCLLVCNQNHVYLVCVCVCVCAGGKSVLSDVSWCCILLDPPWGKSRLLWWEEISPKQHYFPGFWDWRIWSLRTPQRKEYVKITLSSHNLLDYFAIETFSSGCQR